MSSCVAIHLPRDESANYHGKPLMLQNVMFCPALTWCVRAWMARGVERFFVVCEEKWRELVLPCFPPDQSVELVEHDRWDALRGDLTGDGVQVAANHSQVPVYPSNNTMFLGEAVRFGLFEEACHLCGDCMLGSTGGICPISRCAKSLVNGPCGGQKNGKCEVNPENDCAWIMIYKRLEALGQLDKLAKRRADKGYEKVAYPRTINIRGNK